MPLCSSRFPGYLSVTLTLPDTVSPSKKRKYLSFLPSSLLCSAFFLVSASFRTMSMSALWPKPKKLMSAAQWSSVRVSVGLSVAQTVRGAVCGAAGSNSESLWLRWAERKNTRLFTSSTYNPRTAHAPAVMWRPVPIRRVFLFLHSRLMWTFCLIRTNTTRWVWITPLIPLRTDLHWNCVLLHLIHVFILLLLRIAHFPLSYIYTLFSYTQRGTIQECEKCVYMIYVHIRVCLCTRPGLTWNFEGIFQ